LKEYDTRRNEGNVTVSIIVVKCSGSRDIFRLKKAGNASSYATGGGLCTPGQDSTHTSEM
jgi:hypothetical protein